MILGIKLSNIFFPACFSIHLELACIKWKTSRIILIEGHTINTGAESVISKSTDMKEGLVLSLDSSFNIVKNFEYISISFVDVKYITDKTDTPSYITIILKTFKSFSIIFQVPSHNM